MTLGRLVKVWQAGRVGFSQGLKLQGALASRHRQGGDAPLDVLLMLEHPPVYTVGIRTKDYTEDDVKKLTATGAEFHYTNRGGLITFHGPGQLVVYPIINLKNFKPSMRWYVCQVEKAVIDLCSKLNIEASTSPHTGVWIGDNKVCAIGVHGSRFITTHGLALNCNVDLDWYNHIVPCGIKDKGVTSLSKELRRQIDIDEAVPLFMESFSEIFQCGYIAISADEIQEILSS